MIYTNPPLSTTTLIANLKTDGLSVNDENFAEDFLNNVAYLRPFEDVNGLIRFKPNATFDKAVALYLFDAELRNLLFSKILRTICSNSSHHASHRTANQGGTFAFYTCEIFQTNFRLSRDSQIIKISWAYYS